MLIVSGLAQSIVDTAIFKKDISHAFTLFSTNDELDEQLGDIEMFLNNLGWDEIIIEEAEIKLDNTEIQHEVLLRGFDKAVLQGKSVVFQNDPVVL